MPNKLICLQLLLTLSSYCSAQNISFNIFLGDQKIIGSKSMRAVDVAADTFFYNQNDFVSYKSKNGQRESMLFFIHYLPGGHSKLLRIDSLKEDYLDFDILGYDFDKNGVLETIAIWKEESTFYVSIFNWVESKGNVSILKSFESGDLGIPEKWHGKKYDLKNDRLVFYYQSPNGNHVMAHLIFDGRSYRLEEIN